MANLPASVREFVKSVDLQGLPRALRAQDAASDATQVFDAAKQQAQVVGSGLFSFAQGVPAAAREAVSDCALLAQLVANKRASLDADPLKWFTQYAGVLQNLGWIVSDNGWTDYTAKGTAAEVHQKVVEVLTVVLGPSPAALAVLTAAINALQTMDPSSSWVTIFSRESQKARLARFQTGIAESDGTQVTLSMLGCLIQAEANITQVLFFKYRAANATFRATDSKLTMMDSALIDLGPIVRGKVQAYQADYVGSIQDI